MTPTMTMFYGISILVASLLSALFVQFNIFG